MYYSRRYYLDITILHRDEHIDNGKLSSSIVKLLHFFKTVGCWETVFAHTNRILALKCAAERIIRLVIRPLAMQWSPCRKTDRNVVHGQVFDRVCFVPQNNARRNQWVFDVNISQRNIGKGRTPLRGTDLATRQWIC
jgi:hypothetical protein